MSIPTTKASTANVDNGGDSIALARADIKQNIDNVNEIIDHLGAGGLNYCILDFSNAVNENIGGGLYSAQIQNVQFDATFFSLSQDSAQNEFTLDAGTYSIEYILSAGRDTSVNDLSLYLQGDNIQANEVASDITGNITRLTPSTDNNFDIFTLASTSGLMLVTADSGYSGSVLLKLTKLA